jgi:hypothetical protein
MAKPKAKTKSQRPSHSSSSKRPPPPGLPDRSGSPLRGDVAGAAGKPLLDRISMSRFSDQQGDDFVRFKFGERVAAMEMATVSDSGALSKALNRAGIPVVSAATKTAIQRLVEALPETEETVMVARGPGYFDGTYVTVDAGTIGGHSKPIVAFDHKPLRLSKAGSFRGWKDTMRRFGAGQENCEVACAAALCAPILEFLPYPGNVLLEVFGPGSSGKGTMANVFCSVAGSPLQMPGTIGTTWRTTLAALENTLASRHLACVLLDEANAAGPSGCDRARFLADAVFLIAEGVDRDRFNDDVARRFRTVVLSTANKSTLEVAQHARDGDVEEDAIEGRLISFPSDAGSSLGFWTKLPDGYTSAGEASEDLTDALISNHGWALDRFLLKLSRARLEDEEALRAHVRSLARRFVDWAAVDPSDRVGRRRATKAATVYAAGQLGVEWDILPFEKIGRSVKKIYLRAESTRIMPPERPMTAIETVRRHIESNRADIVDLDAEGRPELADQELDAAPGFLGNYKGRRCVLFRASAFDRLFGSKSIDARRELKAQGFLIAKRFQVQTPVRQGEAKSRVYAVAIG